ncbi:MAG: prolyl oligopeptidase family serine peptidase [Acidobacteria bacterium]|nr:prolyl oligopeptidase family serine peptidase [Acidobacteriota bacterium]
MSTRGPIGSGHLAKRFALAVSLILVLTVFQLPMFAQATTTAPPQKPAVAAPPTAQKPVVIPTQPAGQKPVTATPQAAPKAPEKAPEPPKKPLSWADQILSQESYATPPPELAPAVLAPRWQNVTLGNASQDKKWFLSQIGDGPVPMSTFSKPFHELGGVFIDFKANRVRSLTISNNVGIQITSAADGTKKAIQTPPNARVSNAVWSPDGKSIAYYVHTDDATHIWITDVATNKARQVTTTPVLATLVSSFEFTDDSKQIATVLIPDGRKPMPVPPVAPSGPEVKVSEGTDKNRLRTFPSLMSTPYEFALLEWHTTGQLVWIDVQTPVAPAAKGKPAAAKNVKKIGQPAMIRAIDASPDGKFLRVTTMTRPFSYIVPVGNFGQVEEVWDVEGKGLAKVTDRPLDLGTQDATAPDPSEPPTGRGSQQGKRELAWRADSQGLTYLEQEPAPAGAGGSGRAGGGRAGRGGAGAGGDQAGGAGRGQALQRKDRLYQWAPPFAEKGAKVIFENNTRMNGVRYSPDMQTIFFRETAGQNTVEVAVALKEPEQRYTLARFRTDEPAANPGTLVSTRGGGGGGGRGGGGGGGGRGGAGGGSGPVMMSADNTSVYYQGTTYDKNPDQVGPKTFIDKVAIKNGEKKRLFEGDNKDAFESVTTVIDPEAGRFVVERQSPTQVPQFFLVDGAARKQLTENKDLFPDLTSAPKQRVMVERADGVKFAVSVMLPPDWKPGGPKPPAIFWLYPREFTDQDAIDRPDRTFNKNAFQNFNARSMQFFVRMGYAVVVDSPGALPIVGPANQQNNNYVNDLRNSLSAMIDELDRRGLVDRTRLAIGGHSYGAFTTVNAMVHTPFFKAGIAGDGAYNRTLTPIGFQSERRDLWEAPNVYLGMSPFLYANNLTGALLMYHNLHDQNVGTDPTNSIRLHHALNGLGKTSSLYLYPFEDHGPVARETLLDLWARWSAWLDKYVKNPVKVEKKPAPAEPIEKQ